MTSPGRVGWWLRQLAGWLMGLAIAAMTAEAAVRWLRPQPRVQVYREHAATGEPIPVARLGDQPAWKVRGSEARQHPPCEPGATKVLMFGSSIFWGIAVSADEAVSHRLTEDLAAGGGSWCVENQAQPAYVGAQELALARKLIPEARADIVLWEVWDNAPSRYDVFDGVAYSVTWHTRGTDGYPTLVPLPFGLDRWLFRHSEAWWYATLALGAYGRSRTEVDWERHGSEITGEVADLVRAAGGRLVLVLMPGLHQPFDQTVRDAEAGNGGYPFVRRAARDAGLPVVDVAAALSHEDVEALRLDTCCHYNAAGHRALARVLAPVVRDVAEGRQASSGE